MLHVFAVLLRGAVSVQRGSAQHLAILELPMPLARFAIACHVATASGDHRRNREHGAPGIVNDAGHIATPNTCSCVLWTDESSQVNLERQAMALRANPTSPVAPGFQCWAKSNCLHAAFPRQKFASELAFFRGSTLRSGRRGLRGASNMTVYRWPA